MWFVGWVAGDQAKTTAAANRFAPNFHSAFDARMATDPLSHPDAPPGPTSLPQYKQLDATPSAVLDTKADQLDAAGSDDGIHSDDYVRVTVSLATVHFLLTISGHFRIRNVRIGLIVVSIVALVFSVSQLLSLPIPATWRLQRGRASSRPSPLTRSVTSGVASGVTRSVTCGVASSLASSLASRSDSS